MLHPELAAPGVGGSIAPATRRASVVRARPDRHPSAVAEVVGDAYESYQRELFAFLLRVTREPAAAEDIAQEAFLRLCRELGRGAAPPDNVRAWLYRVAGNLAVSRGRHVGVARRWLSRTRSEEELFEAPERTALRFERHERLQAVLAGLSTDERMGLLMAARGFSGHEVATALGRTDVSTRTMLCRARFRLRGLLAEDDPADEDAG